MKWFERGTELDIHISCFKFYNELIKAAWYQHIDQWNKIESSIGNLYILVNFFFWKRLQTTEYAYANSEDGILSQTISKD
jgi:hypothetical protein